MIHTSWKARKSEYRQRFSNIQTKKRKDSEHLRSLKESIRFSQALRVKRTCSRSYEFEAHINTIKDQFVKRGYKKKHWFKTKSRKLQN